MAGKTEKIKTFVRVLFGGVRRTCQKMNPIPQNCVCWVSIDPCTGNIDFYPKEFARKIEDSYNSNINYCELGSKFFNATVHFRENSIYQTTLASNDSRGRKNAGFRSVKRVSNVKAGDELNLWINDPQDEYRLTEENALGYKICVTAVIEENFIIQSKTAEIRVPEPSIYTLKIIFDIYPDRSQDSCKILKFEIRVRNMEELKYELYVLFNEIYCAYPAMFGHFTLYNNYKMNPLLASYDIVSKEIRLMNVFQLDSFLHISEEKMYVCYR